MGMTGQERTAKYRERLREERLQQEKPDWSHVAMHLDSMPKALRDQLGVTGKRDDTPRQNTSKRKGNTHHLRDAMYYLMLDNGWTDQDFVEYVSGRATKNVRKRVQTELARKQKTRDTLDLLAREAGYKDHVDRVTQRHANEKLRKEREAEAIAQGNYECLVQPCEDQQLLNWEYSDGPDALKRNYRRLMSQHHPDKGGDTAKCQTIKAAYERLRYMFA